ncbi:uncharacterized protein LOC123225834 isoform X3 [Mangifera indica]|uniref:uncharacterized protein LOC123225834 isoform X3 n=1 Tax=Mangifera indica TaxID=29780 RepID=UPI001CFB050C|nr:uncharacterized protein LOC123225834 isoform X3 [Mangifera indica]
MAFDLTDFPVPQESNCYMQLGWQCDFSFGYGFDVIEEDATNEKYCIQVLRILITKADTEIDKLEKDLVFLQNELAGVEYEEWFEICCNALRKQIDCLYIANEQPHDLMVLDSSDSTAHTAEHLEENTKFIFADLSAVVKEESQASSISYTESGSFLNTSLINQEKKNNNSEAVCYEQLRQIDVKDSSPNSLKSEAGDLDEKEVLSSVKTETSMKAEAREHCFTSVCNKVIQTSLNSTDERKYDLEVVMDQSADIMSKNSNGGGLKHIVNRSNKNKKLCASNLKIVSDESEENSSASIEGVIGVDSASKSMRKNANLSKRVKLISFITKDLDSNICEPEEGYPDVKRIMRKPDFEVNGNEEVCTYRTTTAGKDKIVDSSSNPEGKVNPPKAEKQPATAVMQDANADALRHATGVSWGSNNSDLRFTVPRQAKVGNSYSSSESTCTISQTTISRQEKGGNSDTSLDALRPATGLSRRRNDSGSAPTTSRQLRVQNSDISPAALSHATGLDQRRNNSDSRVPAFRQAIVGNCSFDKKLCDFAHKSASKRGMKESSLILSDVLKSSNLSSEAKGKRKPSLQNVKAKKSCLIDTQQSALSSLLHLQDDKGKMTANAQTVERKTQGEDVQTAESVANSVKFNTDLSVKPQKNYVKRKFKLNPPSAKESGFQSAERIPQSSFIAKAKRQWKSEPVSDSSSSDHSLNTKILKKAAQHGQCEGKEKDIGFDDSQNSISVPQKKRKKNTSIPEVVEIKGSTLQIDLLKSPIHSTGKDDIWITKSCYNSIDSCTEVVTSSPFSTSKLMELKIGELRTIAKEQKLTKYYKLRKTDLVERIANKLGSC